jgi:hypothetical protein
LPRSSRAVGNSSPRRNEREPLPAPASTP